VDGGIREDFNFEKPEEETHYSDELVLYVQEELRDHRSSSSPL